MSAYYGSDRMQDHRSIPIPIPTPSLLPPPPALVDSLSDRINRSTRPLHTQLNRLILTRLPLALPPYTTNPLTYVSGLLHIAPIYTTFEDIWAALLSSPQLPTTLPSVRDACDPEQPLLDSKSIPLVPNNTQDPNPLIHTPRICTRTQSLLTHLRLPGLLRSGRLRADIRSLTNTPDHQISAQLRDISHSGPLAEFLQHIRTAVEANPHVLLAYAWVLYMALFSGGRYLRAALKEAGGQGESFWTRDSSPIGPYSLDDSYIPPRSTSRPSARSARASTSETNTAPTRCCPITAPKSPHLTRLPPPEPNVKAVPGLQFFNFAGASDGEDLKHLLKSRVAEAEILLTAGEKDDIVLEAQHIFTYLLRLMNQLDAVVGTAHEDLENFAFGAMAANPSAGGRLNSSRDSVSVAKERMTRRDTFERNKDGSITPDGGDRDGDRNGGFLSVVAGSVAKIVLFRGRIPGFDQVVRRFSRSGTPQVTFMDEPEKGVDEKSERAGSLDRDIGEMGEQGVCFAGVAFPILAVLLLLFFILLYRSK